MSSLDLEEVAVLLLDVNRIRQSGSAPPCYHFLACDFSVIMPMFLNPTKRRSGGLIANSEAGLGVDPEHVVNDTDHYTFCHGTDS
jgi:hypothetical protein